jgi:hypothetical protein
MDGRLQNFREDFAGAVSIWIVTGEGRRYQREEKALTHLSIRLFMKQRAVYIWVCPVKFAFFPADWYLSTFRMTSGAGRKVRNVRLNTGAVKKCKSFFHSPFFRLAYRFRKFSKWQ